MAERSAYLSPPATGEERAILAFVVVSLLVHLIVYLIVTPGLMREPIALYEEWEIETQFVSEYELSAPSKSAIPESEKAKDAAVPKSLLPQLPKKFAIDEKNKGETIVDEGVENNKDKTDKLADNKAKEDVAVKEKEDEANQLQRADALRRLAIESLRQREKFSKTLQSEDTSAIAKLKEKVARNKDINIGGITGIGAGGDRYRAMLSAHIKRCYSVPSAYNMEKADLLVTISIIVNDAGGVMSSSVKQTSGDEVFDEMAYKAVKDCSPMPSPPSKLAGTSILLNFSPKSF